jgi:RNA polymerase sigma-54 factor
MSEVADELSLHASTISRAIAGKHVATAFGTMPLREFCAGGSADGRDSAGHARSAVAERIASLVESEDKSRPLSDDTLVERLREQGIEIARRTVAKLREDLGILSSYRRRQHGAKD